METNWKASVGQGYPGGTPQVEELELDSEGMVPTGAIPLLPSAFHDAASDFQAHSVSESGSPVAAQAAVQNYRAGARSCILLIVTCSQ